MIKFLAQEHVAVKLYLAIIITKANVHRKQASKMNDSTLFKCTDDYTSDVLLNT